MRTSIVPALKSLHATYAKYYGMLVLLLIILFVSLYLSESGKFNDYYLKYHNQKQQHEAPASNPKMPN